MTLAPSAWTAAAAIAANWWDPPDDDGDDRDLALRCAADLRVFIREAWPLLEPARPFVGNWHIDTEAEHLMAVSAGELPRLILNQPPGTSKSSVVCVLWPAWEWLEHPSIRGIFASYAQTFAFRDSRKMRNLIQSRGGKAEGTLFERRGYQGVLALLGQGWRLALDQNTKGRYDTTAGGMRLATSVDGQATGEHGDRIVCLDGGTLIATDQGQLSIRDIVQRRLPVRVLGSSGQWQRVAEYEVSEGRPLLEIETADGARLRCTDDHPIYIEEHGWTPAGMVTSVYGDLHMRSLRGTVRPTAGARGAEHAGAVLLARMLAHGASSRAASELDRRCAHAGLRALRGTVPEQASRGEAAALLLDGVRVSGGGRAATPGVRAVRRVLRAGAGEDPTVLLHDMREHRSSFGGEGDEQRPVRPWRMGDALLAGLHEEATQRGQATRPASLRGVRSRGTRVAGASHRRFQGQPSADQPRDALPLVSPQDPREARDRGRGDAPVRIVAVRRCGMPDAVYNLRVEPDHDYYANGLLVHNCDDPLNPKQARSLADRTTVNLWWDETMTSRFIDDKAAAVIVHQRLHEADLTGHLLARDSGWHHLCLPAEYIASHPFTYPAKVVLPSGRELAGDPRTTPGELLDAKRLSAARLAKLAVDLGSYAFAGQYQQQPAPEGGGIFKKAWFTRRWQPDDLRRLELGFDRIIASWDMSFKDTKGSDFVVGQVWGFHGADCYLLAQVRGRFSFTTTLHVVKALALFEPYGPAARAKLVEDKANGTAVIDTLRSTVGGLIAVEPEGGKYVRAAAVTPYSEAGNVILPAADTIPCPEFYVDAAGERHELTPTTVADWLYEHGVFPAGANDDQVDAHSQALTWANPMARPEPEPEGLPRPKSIMSGVLNERW